MTTGNPVCILFAPAEWSRLPGKLRPYPLGHGKIEGPEKRALSFHGGDAILDSLDHQLIGLLRVDARLSTVELAKTLGVSRGTIVNRLARLEKEGTIIGYTVCVKPDIESSGVVAWVSIAVEGDGTREVVRALLSEPAVRSLHDTNGRWDLVAEVEAGAIDQLSQLLERIRAIKGIENTETSIHLRSFKSRDQEPGGRTGP